MDQLKAKAEKKEAGLISSAEAGCHPEEVEAKRAEELGELKNNTKKLKELKFKVVILVRCGHFDFNMHVQVPFYCVCQWESCNGKKQKEGAHAHDDFGESQGSLKAPSICATIVAVTMLLLH